jgi:hypothetical protein
MEAVSQLRMSCLKVTAE